MDIIEESSRAGGKDHLGSILGQWWLVAATVAVGLILGGVVLTLSDDVYRADAGIVTGPRDGFLSPDTNVEAFTQTIRSIFESDAVARVVSRQTPGLSQAAFAGNLHVTSRPDSAALKVSYEAGSESAAVTILGRAVNAFVALVDDRLAAGTSPPPVRVVVFDDPHVVGKVAPRPLRTLLFAGLAGLVLGIGIALLREQSPRNMRSLEEAEEALQAPVFGALPDALPLLPYGAERGYPMDGRLIAALDDLRSNVELVPPRSGARIVVLTGADDGARKAEVLASLGLVSALAGNDVVCVGAGESEPFARAFGITDQRGSLGGVAAGHHTVADALTPVWIAGPSETKTGGRAPRRAGDNGLARLVSPQGVGRLWVLPPAPRGGGLGTLRADQVDAILGEIRAKADLVLVDAPSLLDGARSFPYVMAADLLLVHVQRGRTRLQALDAARRRLSALRPARVAVVATGALDRGAVASVGTSERETGFATVTRA